jgi:hypothetical protein
MPADCSTLHTLRPCCRMDGSEALLTSIEGRVAYATASGEKLRRHREELEAQQEEMRKNVKVRVVYRSCTLPPLLPPGVFFNSPRCPKLFFSKATVWSVLPDFLSRAYSKSRAPVKGAEGMVDFGLKGFRVSKLSTLNFFKHPQGGPPHGRPMVVCVKEALHKRARWGVLRALRERVAVAVVCVCGGGSCRPRCMRKVHWSRNHWFKGLRGVMWTVYRPGSPYRGSGNHYSGQNGLPQV